MKVNKKDEKKGILEKLSDCFMITIDLLCGKYLFFTVLLNIAIVTKPVVSAISVTTGMYMYYTAETSIIGSRPCRLFGLLSFIYPNKDLFMMVFRIMYFIVLILLSVVIYQLIKRISESEKKLISLFAVSVIMAFFFRSTEWPLLSLTMMYALTLAFGAVYLLKNAKEKYRRILAPLLASAAILIDVRTIYLCLFWFGILLINKNSLDTNGKRIACLAIGISCVVFTGIAIISNDNKNSDDIKEYYEIRYNVNYDQEDNYTDETGMKHMSNGKSLLMPESFFKVNSIDLVIRWIPNIASTLIGFTNKDIFNGICCIYITAALFHNYLVEKEEKLKSESVEKLSS